MIDVYKMGMSYYANSKCDRNSGLTELKMIELEAKRIEKKAHSKKVLMIVNGIRDKADEEFIDRSIGFYDMTFFIMSDAIALKTSLDIINRCDWLIHQVPDSRYKFEQVRCKQTYGFIPDLFYKYVKQASELGFVSTEKTAGSRVYFGGNNTGRQDKFDAYNIMESDMFSRSCKIDGEKDERLDHISYLRELAKHKYSLTICRDEYRRSGWLTSRFFESVALGCLPIIDYDYDKLVKVSGMHNYFRSFNESSLREIVKFYDENDAERLSLLSRLSDMCDKTSDMFSKVISSVIVSNCK